MSIFVSVHTADFFILIMIHQSHKGQFVFFNRAGLWHKWKSYCLQYQRSQFESSHRENYLQTCFTVNCWKDENKEKDTTTAHLWKVFNNVFSPALVCSSTVEFSSEFADPFKAGKFSDVYGGPVERRVENVTVNH